MDELWNSSKEGNDGENSQNRIPRCQNACKTKGFPVPHDELSAEDEGDIDDGGKYREGPVLPNPSSPSCQVKLLPLVRFHVGGLSKFNRAKDLHLSVFFRVRSAVQRSVFSSS